MIFFVAMTFMVGLMNFVVPLQIGARDVAFPYLNNLSLWLTVAGAMLINVSLAVGAPMRNDENSINPETGKIQKLSMFSQGNATSRAPICSGKTRLPKPPVKSGMMTSQIIALPWTL